MAVQDRIKQFRLSLSLTQKQYRIALIHFGLMLFALCVGIALSWSLGTGSIVLVLLSWFVTVLSLLDRLDIIEFSRTVERKTKCVICGRVSIGPKSDDPESQDNQKVVKTTVTNGPKGTERTKEIVHEVDKGIPLEGVIICNKLVCTDCITKVGKIKWDQ